MRGGGVTWLQREVHLLLCRHQIHSLPVYLEHHVPGGCVFQGGPPSILCGGAGDPVSRLDALSLFSTSILDLGLLYPDWTWGSLASMLDPFPTGCTPFPGSCPYVQGKPGLTRCKNVTPKSHSEGMLFK